MGWLFGQLWFLMLIAFLVGAAIAWLLATVVLPREDDLETEAGVDSTGVFG